METPYIIIDGMDKLEVVDFKSQLENQKIDVEDFPKKEAEIETGKVFEFVSTTVIVLSIAQITLSAFKLWWQNRKSPVKNKIPKFTVKLPNNVFVKFSDDGNIESVLLEDGTLIESSKNSDSEQKISENIGAFSELIKAVQDLLKDIIDLIMN